MPNTNEPLTKQDLVEVLDRLKAIEETILTKQEFRETIERELLTKKEFQVAIEHTLFTKKEFNDAVETIFKPSFDDVYSQLDGIHGEIRQINGKLEEHDHRFDRLEEASTRMRSLMVTKPYLDDKLSTMEGRWAQRFRSLVSVLHEKELLDARDVETIHRRSVVA